MNDMNNRVLTQEEIAEVRRQEEIIKKELRESVQGPDSRRVPKERKSPNPERCPILTHGRGSIPSVCYWLCQVR